MLINLVKIILSAVSGLLISFLNQYQTLTILVLLAAFIDIVTGFMQAKINKNIESKKMSNGLWKKCSIFVCLFFGYFLDLVVGYLAENKLPFSLDVSLPLGSIIGGYIIINECISICENLYKCGVPIPKFIIQSFNVSKEKMDESEEDTK